jgi:hypothetical protein
MRAVVETLTTMSLNYEYGVKFAATLYFQNKLISLQYYTALKAYYCKLLSKT